MLGLYKYGDFVVGILIVFLVLSIRFWIVEVKQIMI